MSNDGNNLLVEMWASRRYDELRAKEVPVPTAIATVQRELGEEFVYLPVTFYEWLSR